MYQVSFTSSVCHALTLPQELPYLAAASHHVSHGNTYYCTGVYGAPYRLQYHYIHALSH